jgi:hypothetical protein
VVHFEYNQTIDSLELSLDFDHEFVISPMIKIVISADDLTVNGYG